MTKGTTHFVGIAEMKLSDQPSDVLVASSLGSCLGIAAYDPERKLAGMIHCLLPLSKSDPEKAQSNPATYVDTGVIELIRAMGGKPSNLLLMAVGGANINDENNVFEIGKKNFIVLKKILWKNDLLLQVEDIGGNLSRTLTMHVDTGKAFVKSGRELRELN